MTETTQAFYVFVFILHRFNFMFSFSFFYQIISRILASQGHTKVLIEVLYPFFCVCVLFLDLLTYRHVIFFTKTTSRDGVFILIIDKFVYLVDYRIESSGLFVAFALFSFSHTLCFSYVFMTRNVFSKAFTNMFLKSLILVV